MEDTRTGSNTSLLRQTNGSSQPGGPSDVGRVHRSASNANPAALAASAAQKPSRRYSQDTHAAAGAGAPHASAAASGMFSRIQILDLV